MIWARRTLPMLLGAGLVYLGYRLAAANALLIEVDFLTGRIEALALWKALLGAFAIGAGSVGAFALLQMARAGLLIRRYRKKLLDLEIEVHQLRNLPLVPEEAARAEGPVGVLGGVDAPGS